MSFKSTMRRWRSRNPKRQIEYERNLSIIESMSGVPQRPKQKYYEEEEKTR